MTGKRCRCGSCETCLKPAHKNMPESPGDTPSCHQWRHGSVCCFHAKVASFARGTSKASTGARSSTTSTVQGVFLSPEDTSAGPTRILGCQPSEDISKIVVAAFRYRMAELTSSDVDDLPDIQMCGWHNTTMHARCARLCFRQS